MNRPIRSSGRDSRERKEGAPCGAFMSAAADLGANSFKNSTLGAPCHHLRVIHNPKEYRHGQAASPHPPSLHLHHCLAEEFGQDSFYHLCGGIRLLKRSRILLSLRRHRRIQNGENMLRGLVILTAFLRIFPRIPWECLWLAPKP